MRPAELTFIHLYPDYMNLYGDSGNMTVLLNRARWRNFKVTVKNISFGDKISMKGADLIFIGGGQDKEQNLILPDLLQRKDEVAALMNNNVPILAICGGFQLLGQYYQTYWGKKVNCLGLLDYWTVTGKKRMIGKIMIKTSTGGVENKVLGFENHAGRTYLGKNINTWGRVLKGYGNNGKDKSEGVIFKNFIGTYLHGPLLPYHPLLADFLLNKALNVKNKGVKLTPLNNTLEKHTHTVLLDRMGQGGKRGIKKAKDLIG